MTPASDTRRTTHRVPHAGGSLHVIDYPGESPAIVMMHGFPDDLRIYDRLVPYLAPRRIVAFDWLGFGRSDRRPPTSFAPTDRQRELRSVLDTLAVEDAIVVGHDASGPEAIDFAIDHPGRTAGVVLLNTYYGRSEALRFPEMIALMGDPSYSDLVDAMMTDESQRLWILGYTAKRFGFEPGDPDSVGAISVLPQFFGTDDNPDALGEIRAWTRDLPRALDAQDDNIACGRLRALDVPVTVAFGVDDTYLNPNLARHLAELFGKAQLELLGGASHWPQWNQPEAVAEMIKAAPVR